MTSANSTTTRGHALVCGFHVDVEKRQTQLQLRLRGTSDDCDLDLWFDNATVLEPGVIPIAEIMLHLDTEVLYDEIDRVDEGAYEHRLLLWPFGELVVQFTGLRLTQRAIDLAEDSRP